MSSKTAPSDCRSPRRGVAVGVGEGPEEQRQMQTANFQPGRLLGVVNLRYVDERELNEGK